MEYSPKLVVFQLKAAEPLLGYAILHLFPPLYLTRSFPKLLHIYSPLAVADVRPFASSQIVLAVTLSRIFRMDSTSTIARRVRLCTIS